MTHEFSREWTFVDLWWGKRGQREISYKSGGLWPFEIINDLDADSWKEGKRMSQCPSRLRQLYPPKWEHRAWRQTTQSFRLADWQSATLQCWSMRVWSLWGQTVRDEMRWQVAWKQWKRKGWKVEPVRAAHRSLDAFLARTSTCSSCCAPRTTELNCTAGVSIGWGD